MLQLRFASVIPLIAWVISFSAHAASDQLYILKKTASSAPTNLLDPADPSGQTFLPSGVVDQRTANGEDTSRLDPKPDDVWGPEPLQLSNAAKFNYPPENAELRFLSRMDALGKYRAQVEYQGRPFRLVVDMNSHESLAAAALLRRLGYKQDSPRAYRQVTLRFDTLDQYKEFFDYLVRDTRFRSAAWVTAKDEKKLEVVLQDVNLEQPRIEDTQYFAGQVSLQFIRDNRAARALIVPLSLLDIRLSAGSVNLFPWEFGRILSERVVLFHPSASVFASQTTFEDAKWIARKIAKMISAPPAQPPAAQTAPDPKNPAHYRLAFAQILRESRFPEDIQELLLEKLIARRNHMVQLFDLTRELEQEGYLAKLDFNPKKSVPPHVIKGEATLRSYPGYAGNYTVGDPESPLRWSEIRHFVKMELISQALGVATSTMNKELLEFHTVEEGNRQRIESFVRQVADACARQAQENPNEPCRYQVPLKAWAKPLSGIHVSANRSLVTGTFYGSDTKAPVQLVDNVSIGANIGAFGGTTAVEGAMKNVGFSGSVGYQRAYTHVRPIMSLEASKKESWANLFVPAFMKKQGRVLNVPEKEGKHLDGDVTTALQEFVNSMEDGEVFTITDAFVANAGPQFTIPLTALVGPGLAKLGPSIGVGVSGDWAIMKRTMITKRSGRIEVYDNKMNVRSIGANMSLNFWIQLAKVSAQWKKGGAETDVMSIDLAPATVKEKIDNKHYADERRRMLLALESIFVMNEIDLAREYYPPTHLEHELKAKLRRAKVLLWSWATYEENHKVKVTIPEIMAPHLDANKRTRTLYASKKTAIKGRDIYGFVGTVLSKVSGVDGLLSKGDNLNDSGTFLGRASWSTVRTEAEITPDVDYKPMTIVEEFYSGWNLSKEKLIAILRKLELRVESVAGPEDKLAFNIFRPAVFSSTDKVQFFEIRSNLVIYNPGVEQFRRYITEEKCVRGVKCRSLLVKLVDLTDPEDLRNACRTYITKQVTDKELSVLDPDITDEKYEELTQTNKFWRKCIKPWMRKTIRLVRKMPDEKNREETNQQINTIMYVVSKHADLGRFLSRLSDNGKRNFFFQVRVSGFRTKDENGDQAYDTDSIGTVGSPVTLGAFADFRVYDLNKPELDRDGNLALDEYGNPKYPEWKISDYELQGRYFGNGL